MMPRHHVPSYGLATSNGTSPRVSVVAIPLRLPIMYLSLKTRYAAVFVPA
jgi:hypothetical protein